MQDRLRVLEENNPVVQASVGGLSYVIRMQNAADIPEDDFDFWFWMTGEGAVALLIAPAMNPMFAGAVFLGGAIVLPGSIIGYLHDKSVWESIASAMSTFPFTQSIEQSLVRRLKESPMDSIPRGIQAEIVINLYGLVYQKESFSYCLVVSGDLIFSRMGDVLAQDSLNITSKDRCPEAPPPQCATLEGFARKDGLLISTMLAEYADILAALAANRITSFNPQ